MGLMPIKEDVGILQSFFWIVQEFFLHLTEKLSILNQLKNYLLTGTAVEFCYSQGTHII